jgi:hypothetical protein
LNIIIMEFIAYILTFISKKSYIYWDIAYV